MNKNVLSGITILVTRPEHQAEDFCAMVEQAGGTAIRFPVIEIKAIAPDEVATASLKSQPNLDGDCLIFISANAVRLGLQAIRQINPERLSQSRIMAIGKATAEALKEHGVTPHLVPPSPYNSEALLAMSEMQNVTGRRYTLIKGKGGRTYLQEQLTHRGAIIEEIDIYVRIKPDSNNATLEQFIQAERPIVAITSVKGLHYLFEMTSEEQTKWLKSEVIYLVPGERVADAVRDLHIRQKPLIAENATDEIMFNRLTASFS